MDQQQVQLEEDSTVSLWNSLEQELGLSGRFVILSRIGAGGMGEVFKARQIDIDREVAIKVLSPGVESSPDARMRFQREAKILATLEHPNILRLYSFGVSGERLYQVMDYLEGRSLSTRLEQGPLSVDEFADIFTQIIRALEYASVRGLVHRDIKPSNIFLTAHADGTPRAVLLDFGLVRQLELNDGSGTVTATQAVLGSPPYMSPEQCRGSAVDAASDIYSLGCTMHECLAGKPPFLSNTVGEILLQQMNEAPPLLQAFENSKPVQCALPSLIHRCLAKEQSARYRSFQELESDFSLALLTTASTTTFTPPGAPSVRANKKIALIALACAVVIAIMGLAINKLAQKETSPFESKQFKSFEQQQLEEISKWSARLKATEGKSTEQQHAFNNLVSNCINLADYYREKKHRFDDAERIYNEALSNSNNMMSPRWIASSYKGLSEVNASRAHETQDPEKRAHLLQEAEQLSKLATEQILHGNNLLRLECFMQYSLVLFQAGRYKDATLLVDRAIDCGLAQPHSRSPLGANYARAYARSIQNEIAEAGKSATSKDQLDFCMTFLSLCDFLNQGDTIQPDEPALKYAHEWFERSKVATKSQPINGINEQQIQKRFEAFDKLAANSSASSTQNSDPFAYKRKNQH